MSLRLVHSCLMGFVAILLAYLGYWMWQKEWYLFSLGSYGCSVGMGMYMFCFLRATRKLLPGELLGLVLGLFFTSPLYACSVCFGDKDSLMSKGLVAGVTFMLGIVVLLLLGFASFFIKINRKSKETLN